MPTFTYKPLINRYILLTGLILVSVIFFQIASGAEEGQIEAALKDLSDATSQTITSEEQARAICDQEQFLDICADIGKEHNLYTLEEIKQVDAFLNEVKGQVLSDIKSCPDEECLIKVANDLAKTISSKNPTLATNLDLTTKIIEGKKQVVEAAKEAGVNFQDCESMNPDTAPVDLLRKCARLAKDIRVQKHIPEERRALAAQFEDSATLKLREALSAGKYQCGDGTLEGCGNYCLNPGARTEGANIPPVCKQIAAEIFGPNGIKELELAHRQVNNVRDFYSKKFTLVLPDGRELVGEGQIRNACDQAFSGRNLEIAKICGNFAVKNGFVSQAEVDNGLRLLESFVQKGQNATFDQCLNNPTVCRDFIPEEDRGRFDAGRQIFEIMRAEIGFDPQQCERGAVDETIGVKCFEGSKRALAKIESLDLAGKSREARFIIEEIKGHIVEGENMNQRKDEFKQVFSQQGGPGGCRSEAECFSYCSDSANGPECISFGAKQNISGFRGREAIERFQEYNQNIHRPGLTSEGQYPQFPGQGPYPDFQPPGQVPGFTRPGPGFSPPPGTAPYYPPYPGGPGPIGPSPECFAAIQSGDFVKAKTVCYVPPSPIGLPTPLICPASPYVECPAGQYRESFRNQDGCFVDGPCKPASTYSPGPYPTYSQEPYPIYSRPPGEKPQCSDGIDNDKDGKTDFPADHSCYGPDDFDEFYPPEGEPYPTTSAYPTYLPPSGQRDQIWNANGLRSSIRSDADPARIEQLKTACANVSSGANVWMPSAGDPSSKDFGMPDSVKCQKAATCTASQYFDGANCVSSGPSPTYSSSPYPTYSPPGGQVFPYKFSDGKVVNNYEEAKSYCYQYGPGSGRGIAAECETKFGIIYSSGSPSPYPTYSPGPSANCPSGYHYHGESGGFCMNDQENYGGTCYNSAGTSRITCPAQPTYSPAPTYSPGASYTPYPSPGTCPAGQYWYWPPTGAGYCKVNETPSPGVSYTPYPGSCGDHVCGSGETTSSCPIDCGGSTTSYTPYPTATSGTPSSGYCGDHVCGSGETASSCYSDCGGSTTSYTPYPTTSYTPYPTVDPATSCASSGGTWNGSSCVYPTPPPSTPYPTTEYTPPPSTYSPPPTSIIYQPYMIAHCQQLGRTWNGKICQANGLFARFYENSGVASILRLFYLVP